MISEKAFQTRARTVDHLGREQIADCPTAISELWKNSFDAYARHVELNIYDGKEPVVAIIDDGHGMSLEEFTSRWLVVGTESKADDKSVPHGDREGLNLRPRQGQKGIGRLSCANLGPVLLLVSKRVNNPFVAALINWNLFENPFLNLSDIFIPIIEFDKIEKLFKQLPDLKASLSENIIGGSDKSRKERILDAWKKFDEFSNGEKHRKDSDNTQRIFSLDVLSTISNVPFEPRHLQQWTELLESSCHGTALLVSSINYDLRVQLDKKIQDISARAASDRFFETLSSFVDPFVDPAEPEASRRDFEFSYVVRAWKGDTHRVVVGLEKQFDKRKVDNMEHRIEGKIQSNGTFVGRVKAFGEWLPDDCVIEPPKDLSIPTRRDSRVGTFELYIASMEFNPRNSTHPLSEFRHYRDLAGKYSGFMIFRDGLRVLPYGRTDNDFFEIEMRRSKNVGREFWNHRQMFGRLAITYRDNPNLKDKAGREGLIDNRAAKTLRDLVANILKQSARMYFGSASEIRKEQIPLISAENERKRADEARERLRKRQRREFSSNLKKYSRKLPELLREIQHNIDNLNIETEDHISQAQSALEGFRERLSDLKLPGAPKNLGLANKDKYAEYLTAVRKARMDIEILGEQISRRIEEIKPTKPTDLLRRQMDRQSAQISARLSRWRISIKKLQQGDMERINAILRERNGLFHTKAATLVDRFEKDALSYAKASKLINTLKQDIDEQNSDLFVPYISALESLQDRVDLQHLATFGMEEVIELRSDLEKLNSLAQLGIAVEILGHELQSYDDMIGSGLGRLPKSVRHSLAARDIELGYEGLTDQLRFLSPLRIAGNKTQRWVSGAEIFDYVSKFFRSILLKNHISLTAGDAFLKTRIFDQQSRIYPVFINLLNNSIYWLSVKPRSDRKIVVDVMNSEVVVSDNGPGVDLGDIDDLFSLFFTKKIRGGRGIGLYLCRANLSVGGHRIRYEPSAKNMPLEGANFAISFRGADFGE